MTHNRDFTLPGEILESLAENGLDILPELIRTVVNEAMKLERQRYLNADPYERSPGRIDQANGYKPKTVKTRVGQIEFSIPQVREGSFYPSALEKGRRSERALLLAMAEMYVQGVSTRRVSAVVEELCGFEVSSSDVSRASAELDETLNQWRERPLGECRYLWLDARYEKVRQAGQVRDAAVLIATGLNESGKRQVLGVSVALSEHEAHWRAFLRRLVERGLHRIELVISDDHAGLKAARQAVFGSIPWQRCQFHLQQNAAAYVPRKALRSEVAEVIREIFAASSRHNAEWLLQKAVKHYTDSAPELADWMAVNLPQGLTIFDFPKPHQRRLRTINGLERLNREIRRRTRVAVLFPNVKACLRLVSAILMEISEEWETGKVYLSLDAI